MIYATQLLKDLQRQLKTLEDDLRERVKEVAEIDAGLREQYRAAKEASRTGVAYEIWRDELLTQAAVAWILGCVFVRFLEDNQLIPTPLLSGPGERRQRALDEHELYFKHEDRRTHSDRNYLLHVFEKVRGIPAAAELFDPKHNPLWAVGPTGDGATELLRFWQRVDPDTGVLIHDFTDLPPSPPGRGAGGEGLNTRFLGDLYQDLSEDARKKYALLQTPEFVEEFILDRTLTPAVEEFGFPEVRLIDPTCGSGHFLLGAFHRLFDLWVSHEPGTNPRALAQRALDQVFGVDLNPYAVAIARFRLLIAALKASSVHSIRREEAPAFHVNVAAGDSLLHGRRFDQLDLGSGADQLAGRAGIGHAFFAEDLEALNRILGQQYHAVVGNPPYVTVKDKALNQLYRDRYRTCHRQYSLAVPFTERFFQLALTGRDFTTKGTKDTKGGREGLDKAGAGFVGMITANSFMKREFGKKLIEDFFPRVDITHVIDTSGAYIPGHGTPTVILLGRDREPVGDTVRTVMGIKGEPSTPDDPSKGMVWSAIISQVDRAGSESEWVSCADASRQAFAVHPWSIGGGGAADLKDSIETASVGPCSKLIEPPIGRAVRIAEEESFMFDSVRMAHSRIPAAEFKGFLIGENLRDWSSTVDTWVWYPYFAGRESSIALKKLWPWRTTLAGRKTFQGVMADAGSQWFEYMQHTPSAYITRLSIPFAFVATHNHFVLDRGGKVFNRSAPVIKLPAGATEDDHLALLGLLNSSTAMFWMKQVFHGKGQGGVGQESRAEWEEFREFTGTGLKQFPVTDEKPLDLARELDRLAREQAVFSPPELLSYKDIHHEEHEGHEGSLSFRSSRPSCPSWLKRIPADTDTASEARKTLDAARRHVEAIRRRMIALQEELDWRCYQLYGITPEELTVGRNAAGGSANGQASVEPVPGSTLQVPEINLGERAFEILMARQVAAGELETTWFERHRSIPITEIPAQWPEDYRLLVERRIALIERDRNVGLIERPEYKRRWNQESWVSQEQRALRGCLLDRLETPAYWPDPELQTTRRLADHAGLDSEFMQVAELYRGHPDFDVHALVAELVESEAIPFLPVLRYKPTGLRKRQVWERTWNLQRREDAIDAEVEERFHHEGHEEHEVREEDHLRDLRDLRALRGSKTNPADAIEQERKRRKHKEIGDIPPPPKYRSVDFLNTTFWRLRGALDVAKERFVSYPHCSKTADPSLVVAWAGWDHLQQAQALAAYYLNMKEQEGWTPERLTPLLAGLLELMPWVNQWHNDPDPNFSGARMGDYFESFVSEEARELRLTPEQIRSWAPAETGRGRRAKRQG